MSRSLRRLSDLVTCRMGQRSVSAVAVLGDENFGGRRRTVNHLVLDSRGFGQTKIGHEPVRERESVICEVLSSTSITTNKSL